MIEGPSEQAWETLLVAIELADNDDDLLCSIGVVLAEPLLQLHWRDLLAKASASSHSPSFRKVLSCVTLSDLPPDVEETFDAMMPPAGSPEDIGRAP
jgi:hypothetical protein